MTGTLMSLLLVSSIAGCVGCTRTGSDGSQGNKGEQGVQGATGTTGPQGPSGLQGEAGLTGAVGPAGLRGEIGLTGSAGPQGLPGLDASNDVNLKETLGNSLVLKATRNGNTLKDGETSLSFDSMIKVPASIDVTKGNAGNGTAELRIGTVVCTYQGKSSKSNPLKLHTFRALGNLHNLSAATLANGLNTDLADIEKGQTYELVSCTAGNLTEYELEAGSSIKLKIVSADTTVDGTNVRADIQGERL